MKAGFGWTVKREEGSTEGGFCGPKPDWGDQLGVRRAECKYGVVTAVLSSNGLEIYVVFPIPCSIVGMVVGTQRKVRKTYSAGGRVEGEMMGRGLEGEIGW